MSIIFRSIVEHNENEIQRKLYAERSYRSEIIISRNAFNSCRYLIFKNENNSTERNLKKGEL